NKSINNRVTLNMEGNSGVYREILPITEINEVNKYNYLNDLVYNRLDGVFEKYGIRVNYDVLNICESDTYDGYELNVPVLLDESIIYNNLFNEIDNEIDNNSASDVPLNKEPYDFKVPNLTRKDKEKRTQNPKKVDLILRNVFNSKFHEYKLNTDIGYWIPVKHLNKNGKLLIVWESKEKPNILIDC